MSKDDNVIELKAKDRPLNKIKRMDISHALTVDLGPADVTYPGFIRKSNGLLTAAGATGKSFWALEAAIGTASPLANKALLNLPLPKHGGALIISAEDHMDTLSRRIYSIGKHLSKEAFEELNENLVIYPIAGTGLNLTNPHLVENIIEVALSINAHVITLDTLNRMKGDLDENSNDEMGKYSLITDYIAIHSNTSVMSLHHIGKTMAVNGRQDEQQSARGAGVLVDNARWQAWMRCMTKEEVMKLNLDSEAHKRFVCWGVSKNNNGAPIDDVWYRRAEGGVLVPADLNFDTPKKKRKANQVDEGGFDEGNVKKINVGTSNRGLFSNSRKQG